VDGADAANLGAGGRALPAPDDPARDALALRAAAALATRGVHFAGLDIAGPWILEANVINPGGLATLAELGDADAPERLVGALLAGAGP
jgi:glutathione synthase/RimK-type ligase-like ATP-grasp enzyme